MNNYTNHQLLLQDFFAEVFGLQLDWLESATPFPFPGYTWMFNPEEMDCQRLYEYVCSHFKIVPGSWLSLTEKSLQVVSLPRRSGRGYFFCYRTSQLPDQEYLHVSQEECEKNEIVVMTVKEYILATAFYRYSSGQFLDLYSETILAEHWFYGGVDAGMVYGFHQHRGRNPSGHDPEGYDGLCLFNGSSKYRSRTLGPRKIFLQNNN